jgi:hypothetical protein
VAGLVVAPAADAAVLHAAPLGLSILGIHIGIHIPSVGDIVHAIVSLFFGTLANALVPGFLRHATVSVIQHLVAVPDPAAWPNVGRLVGDMIYLSVSLLPVMLTVAVLRYWAVGFTGAAHPATALVRAVAVVGGLVLYPWGVRQLVGLVNVLTHAILGFPAVSDGLGRLVGVMFGGALLSGVGGVFGAILVIVGVVFAAALYAAQVLVMLMFAVLFVAGPPLLALAVLPETAHLARTWFHVLVGLAMVPLGWTVLFATAGALTLDATDFTAGTGGLPSTFAAAFAALITFVLAVRLPLVVLGELRHLARSGSLHTAAGQSAGSPSASQGVARVAAARERLRRTAVDGTMSLGRSVGAAAGALGAPRGGPLGAAGRASSSLTRRSGIGRAAPAMAVATAAGVGAVAGRAAGSRVGRSRVARAVGERFSRAGAILAGAPAQARAAARRSSTTGASRVSRSPTANATTPSEAPVAPHDRRSPTPPPAPAIPPSPASGSRSTRTQPPPRAGASPSERTTPPIRTTPARGAPASSASRPPRPTTRPAPTAPASAAEPNLSGRATPTQAKRSLAPPPPPPPSAPAALRSPRPASPARPAGGQAPSGGPPRSRPPQPPPSSGPPPPGSAQPRRRKPPDARRSGRGGGG